MIIRAETLLAAFEEHMKAVMSADKHSPTALDSSRGFLGQELGKYVNQCIDEKLKELGREMQKAGTLHKH